MTFKPIAPGVPTGGETTTQNSETGSPGPGVSYYPSQSEGYVTGGEGGASPSKGSSVPSRANPQSGTVDTDGVMRESLAVAANYGGHDQDFNPTGSSVRNPAGSRTDEDAGFYGDRIPSSSGTNADGGSTPVRLAPKAGGGGSAYGTDAKSEPGTN